MYIFFCCLLLISVSFNANVHSLRLICCFFLSTPFCRCGCSVRLERTVTATTSLYVPSPAPGPGPGSCKHTAGPPCLNKLVLEHTVLHETSDLFLSPNTTLVPQPDVIPRGLLQSPCSEEYRTPETTIIENNPDNTFSMPTYFDKKKKNATNKTPDVQPLTNFQIFKQKSLNTISALTDRNNKKNEELFNNFPFLTPLANRKNSIVLTSRLSGCIEDEFYCIPSDHDGEADVSDNLDVRARFKSLSNQVLNGTSEDVFTSTPKTDANKGQPIIAIHRNHFGSERIKARPHTVSALLRYSSRHGR